MQIKTFISDWGEKVIESDLTLTEKVPLQFASAVGIIMYDYWLAQINRASSNHWVVFLNDNYAVDIANLPYWISSAIYGVFYGTYKGTYTSNERQPPRIAGPDFVTALTACLGLVAGKVAFKWLPKVHLSKEEFNMFTLNSGRTSSADNRDEEINLKAAEAWPDCTAAIFKYTCKGVTCRKYSGRDQDFYLFWFCVCKHNFN
jgi:hypothetical protein